MKGNCKGLVILVGWLLLTPVAVAQATMEKNPPPSEAEIAQEDVMTATESERPAPIVIAHRGASGYAPEHSVAALAMAHAMNVDFIEQDVVLTRDHVPVVLHDIVLDHISNVQKVFPDKKRPDDRYYVLDFTFAELQQLDLTERRTATGEQRYPTRFPAGRGKLKIMSLAQQIELILGLNQTRGTQTGLYIELKNVRWHKQQGYDVIKQTLQVLGQYGLTDATNLPAPVILQCFDPEVLRRIKREFLLELPLIQLIADNSWNESDIDYQTMLSAAGMETLRNYADGVGLWVDQVYLGLDEQGQPQFSKVVDYAKAAGLTVHVYTLRADELPAGAESYEQLWQWLTDIGVDGFFTDFPDRPAPRVSDTFDSPPSHDHSNQEEDQSLQSDNDDID